MLLTHYDILKIAPDAPVEVVRAAYRALCQKHHPDRHPEDPEAARSMALLNTAYEVLSDPDKRREYDERMRSIESVPHNAPPRGATEFPYEWAVGRGSAEGGDDSRRTRTLIHWRKHAVWYSIALLAVSAGLAGAAFHLHRAKERPEPIVPSPEAVREGSRPQEPPTLSAREMWPAPAALPSRAVDPPPAASPSSTEEPTPTPTPVASPAIEPSAPPVSMSTSPPAASAAKAPPPSPQIKPKTKPAVHPATRGPETSVAAGDYVRPAAAPNGERWPPTSGYVPGYEKLNADGLSQLVIDNSKNDFDVFVKVVSVTDDEPKTVRTIYLLAHDQFTLHRLRTGTYEIRYEALNSGTLLRSGMFVLEESAIANGTRYSTVALTLQKTADEHTDTYALSGEEFEQ